MPSFNYVALETRDGQRIFSSLEAITEELAIATLLNRGLIVVSIEQKEDKYARTYGGRMASKELVLFTRQFATLVNSGISIVGGLTGLAKQSKSRIMGLIVRDIVARVERGDSLSEALQKHPRAFDQLYVCMVQAGEKSGRLGDVLSRLATYLEQSARLRRKVKSALMYPAVVTVVAIAITIFLLAKVVPVFGSIYESFNGRLPAPTQFLIQCGNFVKAWLLLIVGGMGGAVYGWFWFIKTRPGRAFWDSWRIKLPVFGSIAHNICLARFARTFSSLVCSGVPILSVMESVAKVCNNVVLEKAINAAAKDIELGEDISSALAKHPVFPDMVLRMISAGEQTGKIDEMLENIADHLDDEVETVLSGLSALIEPILIVFLGVLVGGIVICMFLPIFKLSGLVGTSH